MLNSDNWMEELEQLLKARGNEFISFRFGDKPYAKLSDVQGLALAMIENAQIKETFLEAMRLQADGIPDDDERLTSLGSLGGMFSSWYHAKLKLECPELYLASADILVNMALTQGLDLHDRSAVATALRDSQKTMSRFIDYSE
jgi:hypothetical protein